MIYPLIVLHRTENFHVFSVASLREAAVFALRTADVFAKASVTHRIVRAWEEGEIHAVIADPEIDAQVIVPTAPSRPEKRTSGFALLGRGATEPTIHGIAHAESYAMDLFWDCIARYTSSNMPREFYDQLVHIAGTFITRSGVMPIARGVLFFPYADACIQVKRRGTSWPGRSASSRWDAPTDRCRCTRDCGDPPRRPLPRCYPGWP